MAKDYPWIKINLDKLSGQRFHDQIRASPEGITFTKTRFGRKNGAGKPRLRVRPDHGAGRAVMTERTKGG